MKKCTILNIIKKKEYWNKKYDNDINFLFGFGSIINDESRKKTNPNIGHPIPVRLSKDFGYRRCWNFQSPSAKLTALGLEKVNMNESSTINGIICPIKDNNLKNFDEREEGYTRIKIPIKMLQPTSWYELPKHNCNIWVYVPNGKNNKPGKGLLNANKEYPILQSYIDICINGALQYGEKFTIEFIETTYMWNKYWINDRELARRPWIHEPNYKFIDNLLKKYPSFNNQYKNRKLESEFSIYFIKNLHIKKSPKEIKNRNKQKKINKYDKYKDILY